MSLYVGYLFAYLANSAWQAALLFVAAWLACRLGQHWKPETKHKIWTGTFLAQILLPAVCLLPLTMTAQLLTVVSGPQELQTSALDAVRQWVYKPFQLNGEPVEVETTITVNYQIAD